MINVRENVLYPKLLWHWDSTVDRTEFCLEIYHFSEIRHKWYKYCHVLLVTIDGVLVWILDLLTTYKS
jgi:hypothetical protein